MKPSPCLHPVFITDRNGVKRSVPCGRCAACLVNKGLTRQQRYEDYLRKYTFLFFVTLTFNDEFIPIAYYDKFDNSFIHPCDYDYDGVVYSYSLDGIVKEDCDYISHCIEHYAGLPVLSHRHLINFKKRFRYQFYKLFKDGEKPDLFILSCGEYGPDASLCHRPHYHILFGTNAPVGTDIFKECIYKAWAVCSKVGKKYIYRSFGFSSVERCSNRNAVSYIAKYINCVTHLPKVLKNAKWRPFCTSSTDVDGRLSLYGQSNLSKVFSCPTYEVNRLYNGRNSSVPVPDSYKSRYFPRIPRFSKLSVVSLYRLYGLYEFLDSEKPYERFCEFYPRTEVRVDLPFTGYDFDSIYSDVEFVCYRDCDFKFINDEFIRKRNFMKLYYISRRVCLNARKLGLSHEKYVDKIVEYWNGFEFDKLKRFYKYQEDLVTDILHPVSTSELMSLYYDTDERTCDIGYYRRQFGVEDNSQLSCDSIPSQQRYRFIMEKTILDNTKTKKRNDEFNKRGLKRAPFIPKASALLNNLLTKF